MSHQSLTAFLLYNNSIDPRPRRRRLAARRSSQKFSLRTLRLAI